MKTAPNGVAIIGTKELLTAVAYATVGDDGEPKYNGSTEVDWDGQQTVRHNGHIVWIDEDGREWLTNELIEGPQHDH